MGALLVLPLAFAVMSGVAVSDTHTSGGRATAAFVRLAVDTADPSGSSVAADCGGDYSAAQASLRITTRNNASTVQIRMRDARPNTLYTVWLRLKGTTNDGVSFGGSPLTGAGSTPLAPSTQLDELLTATGSGNGARAVANGLRTNTQGNGQLHVTLDFPVIDGAYPFDRFDGFDPADQRFPLDEPAAVPTAIVFPDDSVDAPFGLRIVSHCTDDLGHGLGAGVRQPWFDWPR